MLSQYNERAFVWVRLMKIEEVRKEFPALQQQTFFVSCHLFNNHDVIPPARTGRRVSPSACEGDGVMTDPRASAPSSHQHAIDKEQGLTRQLSERQLSMIAIGGAIGTGLFLGSALAVRIAGPGVILSYLLAAGIALLLMGCLSEMAVAHPTAGSFGIYAELYLSHWAGFVVRYTYWAALSIAVGGEAVAAAIYTQWWFPNTSGVDVGGLLLGGADLRQRAQRRRIRRVRVLVLDHQGERHRRVHRAGRSHLVRGASAAADRPGELPRPRRLPAEGLARCVAGAGVRDLRFHRDGDRRGHRGRSQRS